MTLGLRAIINLGTLATRRAVDHEQKLRSAIFGIYRRQIERNAGGQCVPYSYRNATMGSTFAARRAGR